MAVVILALVLTYVCAIWLPRLLVGGMALIVAITLSLHVKRTTPLLLQDAPRDLDYNRKPTRAQRRLMRASLRLAIRQTELRSLFPSVVAQADAMSS